MHAKFLTNLASLLLVVAGCGCDICRTQCRDIGACAERDIKDFVDYETALNEWRTAADDPATDCGSVRPSRVAGECAGGVRLFLYEEALADDWHVTLVRYYDAESGAFEGMTRPTVFTLVPCSQLYWPELLDCDGAVVVEVVCGTAHDVGDVINLPGTQ